jgi:hypothetical protein
LNFADAALLRGSGRYNKIGEGFEREEKRNERITNNNPTEKGRIVVPGVRDIRI